MSASLVGSEMCIRDRCSVSLPKLQCSTSAQHASHDQLAGMLQGSLRGPVSYTHLTLPTICSV
eukprot:4645710-Alexandrium_andersonii.AAC.1